MTPAKVRFAHLSRRYRFSASHRLHVAALGAGQNQTLFGKCNNPYGHGHNYAVQITLGGPIDPATGMVVNLADLDLFAQAHLLDRFDQANLNHDAAFRDIVPSTEHLCLELWRIFARFAATQAPATLERIRVEETGNNAFDCFGKGEPAATIPSTFSP